MKGNPWHCSRPLDEIAVRSHRLLAAILKTMAHHGWNSLQAGGVSKSQRDTLFFEKGTPDPDVALLDISFCEADIICIFENPSFASCVKDTIQSRWSCGIQKEKKYFGCTEFKLSGTPWWSIDTEAVHARMLLSQITANIRAQGFKFYALVDMSLGLRSWMFRRVGPAWH